MDASLHRTSLLHALLIQRRVIMALLLREVLTRYGRHGLGVLWLVLEPMLFTAGVATLWYFARLHALSAVPVISFAVTGYSTVLLWRNAAGRCAKAIEPNLSLLYHRNVKVIDVFVARALLELIGATASFGLLVLLLATTGLAAWPSDPGTLLAGWLLMGWFALALALSVGALSERSDAFERVWHILTYLLFPLSGALFMVHWLPASVRDAVLWLPMVHGVEMVRHGYFGSLVPTYESAAYLALVNLLLSWLGLALVAECGRRVQPQ